MRRGQRQPRSTTNVSSASDVGRLATAARTGGMEESVLDGGDVTKSSPVSRNSASGAGVGDVEGSDEGLWMSLGGLDFEARPSMDVGEGRRASPSPPSG